MYDKEQNQILTSENLEPGLAYFGKSEKNPLKL